MWRTNCTYMTAQCSYRYYISPSRWSKSCSRVWRLPYKNRCSLMGNFNLFTVRWSENLSLPGIAQCEQWQRRTLLNLSDTLGEILLQPTSVGDILDPCFINNMDLIHNVKVILALLSDHNIVELTMYRSRETMNMQPTRNSQNLSSLNFHKASWKQNEKEILKQNCLKCLSSLDIDIKFNNSYLQCRPYATNISRSERLLYTRAKSPGRGKRDGVQRFQIT